MNVQNPQRPAPLSQTLEEGLAAIQAFLQQVIRLGKFNLTFAVRRHQPAQDDIESPEYIVDFTGPDSELLLEGHAALLDALEHVARKVARLDESLAGKIAFDCEDWRRVRIEELKLTARVAAERVIETGNPYPLGAMTPRERRVVHLALRDETRVRTESQGFGPERRVVILPASSSLPKASPPENRS
jgi:spoIIIJ-associated protein